MRSGVGTGLRDSTYEWPLGSERGRDRSVFND